MNRLWSPWRMKYITDPNNKKDGCVFCQVQAMDDGVENLIIARDEHAFVIMNAYPYTSGHLMVIPFQHHPDLESLTAEIRAEMMELFTKAMQVLRIVYKPEGFNLGANIGEAAGAGIEEHVHLHIVPRWKGDTNFMSSVGETRVLPETLQDGYRRICAAWASF